MYCTVSWRPVLSLGVKLSVDPLRHFAGPLSAGLQLLAGLVLWSVLDCCLSCLVGQVVRTRAYGSGERDSIPRDGMTNIVFRKRLKTMGALLEHYAR